MRQVKVILSEDVPSLGRAGDLVTVKPGHARNYLVPQGKAILATEGRVRELEHHKRIVAEKVARELRTLEAVRERLEALELEIEARAGEEGRLFGSVTGPHIAEQLAELGLKVDRRKIVLQEPIKEVGDHVVAIRLHRDVVANLKIKVVAPS
jgi:large subunit ribosomal protein L9